MSLRHIQSLTIAALTTFLGLPALASSDEQTAWPSFRGPDALGVAAAELPTTWNVQTGENIRWKTPIKGLAHSSPVVWGNRIYLTSAERTDDGEASLKVGLYGDIKPVDDEGEIVFKVLALDLATGSPLWERTAHQGVPKIKRHTKATHANSTPATNGEYVVAMFGSEGLYAYDTEGELKWKKDFGVLDSGFFMAKTAQWGFASSPVIHGDKVLIQADVQDQSFLAAFDLATGEELWRTNREEVPTWSTPTVAPRPRGDQPPSEQVIVNGWKHTGGYDLETGEALWWLEGGGDIPVPTPIVYGDMVLLTSAHGRERPIRAIHLSASGDVAGTEAIVWHQEKAGNYMQTPIVVGDVAYFCFDNGVLSAYDVTTGERLFQHRLGGGGSGFSASPVSDGKKIYFPSEDGDVYVVAAKREFEQLAMNELGETFMSTPAIAGDTLLFRARSHLIAVGK